MPKLPGDPEIWGPSVELLAALLQDLAKHPETPAGIAPQFLQIRKLIINAPEPLKIVLERCMRNKGKDQELVVETGFMNGIPQSTVETRLVEDIANGVLPPPRSIFELMQQIEGLELKGEQ